MATRAEITAALGHYTKVGNLDAARKLKATLDSMPADSDGTTYSAPKQPAAPEQSVAGRALDVALTPARNLAGAAETAATLGTGMIAAPLAGLGAGLYETAKQVLSGESVESGTPGEKAVNSAADAAAKAVTYVPRSKSGRDTVEGVGKVLAPVEDASIALGPLAAEIPTIMQASRVASNAARSAAEATGVPAAAQSAAARAGSAVTETATAAQGLGRSALERLRPGTTTTDGLPPLAGDRSVGAAEVPAADVRRADAVELGFKDDARLMQSQASQNPQGLGFLTEQAKSEARGPEIRARQQAQARVAESIPDKFIDETGGSAPDFSGGGKVQLGRNAEKVLSESALRQKNKVRAEFKTAELEEGGLATDGGTVTKYLDENAAARGTAPILKAALSEAKRLGIVTKEGAGQATDVKTLYELRKFISKNAGQDGASSYHAGELKKLIDERIATDGGPRYKQATQSHARFKTQYSDASLINGIIENKPGSPDRIIAADQVLDRMLSKSTSVDELNHMRRLMQTHGGESGIQAWKDLQAGGIEHLRDVTYRSAKAGGDGTLRPNSAALDRTVSDLDKAGKLDAMYGKRGAEKIRLYRDVVKTISNVGEANFSGTTNAFINYLETIPFGVGANAAKARKLGSVVVSTVKDRKLRARIQKELE